MGKEMSKRAEEAWAVYEYREHPKGLYYTCYVDGYEQAEKDLIPLINRLCEAILMDWENKADVARETLTKLKEYE